MGKKQLPQQPHSGFIPKLYAYMQQGSSAPAVLERYTNDKWVWFGRRNLWPEQMVSLVQNCAPLKRCVNAFALLAAGGGIRFYTDGGEEVTEARDAFQEVLLSDTTEEDFFAGIFTDIGMMNAASMVVRRAAGADPVRLDHLDVTRLRSGEINKETGKPDSYWWSTNWAKRATNERYREQELPRYGGKVKGEKEAIYLKGYEPGSAGDIYALPWWTGAIIAAEVWTKIDAFNKGQIDTGFSPSVHLHSFTNKPPDKLNEYDERVMQAYSGAMGRGIFHTYGTPNEGAPILTILPRGNHAGELDQIRDNCERVIYSAYGMPPILMGMDTKTGMDGASTAIQQAQVQVDRMLIRPKQQMVTSALVNFMEMIGVSGVWEAKFDPIALVEANEDPVLIRQTYMRSVTVDEHREKMKMEPLGEGGEKLLIAAGSEAPQEPTGTPEA